MSRVYAIGIDVGGSSLKCGLVNHDGEIVHSFLEPVSNKRTEGEIITLIKAAILNCAERARGNIAGVGIGFPGIVEEGRVIGGADNLPGFKNIDLGNIIATSIGMNVVVDNDANMMAWGETKYGAGRNGSDMVFLTTGTGIGGSLLINGKLYGGYKNRGAELGHIIINHEGIVCTCGSYGCFEAYASVSALIRDYALISEVEAEHLSGEIIIKNYLSGDENAIAVLQKHFAYQAAGITSLINIFSPQKVILGGGITESGSFYIKEIENRVHANTMPATAGRTQIVAAELGNNAGLLGCAGRVFSDLK